MHTGLAATTAGGVYLVTHTQERKSTVRSGLGVVGTCFVSVFSFIAFISGFFVLWAKPGFLGGLGLYALAVLLIGPYIIASTGVLYRSSPGWTLRAKRIVVVVRRAEIVAALVVLVVGITLKASPGWIIAYLLGALICTALAHGAQAAEQTAFDELPVGQAPTGFRKKRVMPSRVMVIIPVITALGAGGYAFWLNSRSHPGLVVSPARVESAILPAVAWGLLCGAYFLLLMTTSTRISIRPLVDFDYERSSTILSIAFGGKRRSVALADVQLVDSVAFAGLRRGIGMIAGICGAVTGVLIIVAGTPTDDRWLSGLYLLALPAVVILVAVVVPFQARRVHFARRYIRLRQAASERAQEATELVE